MLFISPFSFSLFHFHIFLQRHSRLKREKHRYRYSTETIMFGRIRSSPSPMELLELERLPPKLSKHDSLSIYESTLVKLKQGSQRNLSLATQDSMDFESNSSALEDSSKVSGLCSEQGLLTTCSSYNSCTGVSSSPSQEQKTSREISIHCLFSKYANTRKKEGSTGCSGGSSGSISTCPSDSESTGCSRF